jgi:hypothetical protein
VGQKVKIVWASDADYFVLIGVNGNAYELDRREAAPDRAGDFRSVAESTGQQVAKELKASEAGKRAARKAAGQEIIVPGIHVPFQIPALDAAASVAVMPRKKIETDPALLAALGNDVVPPSVVHGRPVNRWTAAEQLQAAELLTTPLTASDKAWLDQVFAGRDEMTDTELRELLAQRVDEPAKVIEMRSA